MLPELTWREAKTCITFKGHFSHNELIMNTLRYFDFGASRSLLLLIARIAVVVLFILFGYPKLLGFDGTVQYMAASGAPMPTLAAIIAVIMEVPAAILIVLGFSPARWRSSLSSTPWAPR